MDSFHDGKYILSTKISNRNKDIDNYLIKQMYVQCPLDKNDFMDLAKCPSCKEDSIQILDQQGLLD